MKNSFMTRALAVAMSAAMALSMASAANLTVAEAAAAPDMIKTTFAVRAGNGAKSYKATTATQKAYKIVKAVAGNTEKVTKVKISSTGKSIAITAGDVEAGCRTNISITFKANETGKKTTKKYVCKVLPQKVVNTMTAVQKRANQVELTFGAAFTEAPKAEAFTVTRADKVSVSVKAVALKADDAKTLVLDTYADMKDGQTYTIAYAEKNLEAQFVASDGVVAAVALDKTEIPVNKLTAIMVQELDAKGVVLLENGIGNTGDTRLSVSVNVADGYQNGSQILIYTAGNKATVDINYAGTYDANGNEVGAVKKTVEVTAVAGLVSVSNFNLTVTDSATAAPAWDAASFKANNSVSVGDLGKYIWVNIKDNQGDEIDNYYDYTIASSNTDIVILSDTVLDGTSGINFIPVKEGSCFIAIKKNGATVQTLPIKVVAARKANSLKFTKNSVTLSSKAALNANTTMVATVEDQFGVPMAVTSYEVIVTSVPAASTAIAKNNDAVSDVAIFTAADVAKGMFTPDKNQFDAVGTYQFKVTANVAAGQGVVASKVVNYFSITVKTFADNATGTIGIFMTNDKMNTTVTSLTAADVVNSIYPVVYKNGQVASYVTAAAIEKFEITNSKNVTLYDKTDYASNKIDVTALDYDQTGSIKTLPIGTYTVTLEYDPTNWGAAGPNKTIKTTFTVTDNQEAVGVKVLSNDAENASSEDWAKNAGKIKFFYNGMVCGADAIVKSEIVCKFL